MKLISGSMALLISKIGVIGQQQTQMCFLRHHCIRKKWLFGAVFVPEMWLGRIFSWPRSCDLTPLDFFLRGHIKSLVYANKPATLDDLKDNIQREIANFPVEMCARVLLNWVQRIDPCKRAPGGHTTYIEFNS